MSGTKVLSGQTQASTPKRNHGVVRRSLTSLAGRAKGLAGATLGLAGRAVGLAVTVSLGWHYYEQYQVDQFFGVIDEDETRKKPKRKQVLVLPFHNLKLVEHRKSDDLDSIRHLTKRDAPPTIALEAKELVNIIHKAATDPNICALYGDFGEGMRYPMGYAHIEEIRNAVRIFNESHRVHRDPNVGHNPVFAMPRNGDPKQSHAFGHSFNWNEYFLASAFSNVHLQARGSLSLFGVTMSNLFLRPALDKYGIKAHVFKHGDYKSEFGLLS